jgi:uncharacterized protein
MTTEVDAGQFGNWLALTRASLRGDGGTDVPCGDCVGCCVSSYYIPIRPQDQGMVAKIPVRFLTRVSNQPAAHSMMGYLPDGTCPMLNDNKCTVYRSRPQTCRDYDCRIFAAAGIDAGGDDKAAINKRVREWRFSYSSTHDQAAHEAVRTAAEFIRHNAVNFPGGRAPSAPTGIAVLAIKSYQVFLDARVRAKSNVEIAADIVKASAEFDAASP